MSGNAAATAGAVAAATAPKSSHHSAAHGGVGHAAQIKTTAAFPEVGVNNAAAARRTRSSASTSEVIGNSARKLNGGTDAELLVFDDDDDDNDAGADNNNNNVLQFAVPPPTNIPSVTSNKHAALNQQHHQTSRSRNAHAELKRRSSSTVPGAASGASNSNYAVLSDLLAPSSSSSNPHTVRSSGSSRELLIAAASPVVTSAPVATTKPPAPPPPQLIPTTSTSTKSSTSLSPNSTLEFLAALHRERSLIDCSSSNGTTQQTSISSSAAAGSSALPAGVAVPPRKKFNVTRVDEPRVRPPQQHAVEYADHSFYDSIVPIISSTKTLADYRSSGHDSASSHAAAAAVPASVGAKPHNFNFSQHRNLSSTVAAEEQIPFLLANTPYQLPQTLRRSQRARSEYLPHMPASSATTLQNNNNSMGFSNSRNGASSNAPPTISAAVKSSTLGAALLTGSPMSTLPYKTPSKTPRYLPVSIQAAGYAPTTMEMKDLPPLGSADSHKHLDKHQQQHQYQQQHVAFRDIPAHLQYAHHMQGASSAAVLGDAARAPSAGPLHGGSPTLSSPEDRRRNANDKNKNNNNNDAGARRHDAEAAVMSGSSGGGNMGRPNLHRSVTLPSYAMETAKMSLAHGWGHLPGKKRARARLLQRTGNYNMVGKNIPHRRIRLVSDIWNTLVDLQWRYILLLFLLSYFLTWTMFAFIYWLISLSHGDFDAENLNSADWRPCVQNLRSFTTAYLFSVESQHTIGYGFRYITDECAEAIIFLCLQSAIGAAIQAFMTGLVFTKVQRPTKRAQTLLFSKHAVVCTRDGQLCLLFRVGNMRRSLIIQSSVTAQLVHHRKTIEGELLPFHQHEMHIQLDSMSSSAFLAWPMTACHIINDESPLYDLDKQSMQNARFELIVTLEGVIESTGQTLQARTSYLPEEILWGFRFAKLLSYRQSSGQYVVNFERFHKVEIAPETPVCSAAQLEVAKRAFLARQSLADDDDLPPDDDAAEESFNPHRPPSPALLHLHQPGITIADYDDDDEDDYEEFEDETGQQRRRRVRRHPPMSAPPVPTSTAHTSRTATAISLLIPDDENIEPRPASSGGATSVRRANFFSGGDDTDINIFPPTLESRENMMPSQQQQTQHGGNARKYVSERNSTSDLPVLFTLGPPAAASPRKNSNKTSALEQHTASSRHASEADLEQLHQQNRKRGKVSDHNDVNAAAAAKEAANRVRLQKKSSASFSRLKSHNSMRVPPQTASTISGGGGVAILASPHFSDDDRRSGGELNPTAGGFETEEESAAHVLTSPENRKFLELLKKELPEHDQQLLRRRKTSTNKLHHGAEAPAKDADVYEESMARMRRLGSILADPKYTFDLTAEADELRTANSDGTAASGAAAGGVAGGRSLRTHRRLGSDRRLSSHNDDSDSQPPPLPQRVGIGTSSLSGSSVRLSDLLHLHSTNHIGLKASSHGVMSHEVVDKPIVEEENGADSTPTKSFAINVPPPAPPNRVQSDSHIAGPATAQQVDDVVVQVFNENVNNNNSNDHSKEKAVTHAEMGRRSSDNVTPHYRHSISRHQYQPQQSRHSSVKRGEPPAS